MYQLNLVKVVLITNYFWHSNKFICITLKRILAHDFEEKAGLYHSFEHLLNTRTIGVITLGIFCLNWRFLPHYLALVFDYFARKFGFFIRSKLMSKL